MQAYEGYLDDGRFIPLVAANIPNRRRAILTVLDEPVKKTRETAHAKAWREFFEAVNASDEQLGPEFDEALSQRVNFTREIDL